MTTPQEMVRLLWEDIKRLHSRLDDLTRQLEEKDRRLAALTRERDEAQNRLDASERRTDIWHERHRAAEGQIAEARGYCKAIIEDANFAALYASDSVEATTRAEAVTARAVLALLPPTPATPARGAK